MSKRTYRQIQGSVFFTGRDEDDPIYHYEEIIRCTVTQLGYPAGVSLTLDFTTDNGEHRVVLPVSKDLIETLTAAYYNSIDRLIWPEEDDHGKER